MKTLSLLATAIDRVELVEVNVPAPEAGEVLIESAYTAVSPGTEMRCLAGHQPGVGFPFIPGYSMVGRVVARGPGATLAEGAIVFCNGTARVDRPTAWGAHLAHAVASESALFAIPAGVDLLDAALLQIAAIPYRGVRLAETRPHDEVAVVGLGVIGQIAARLHRLAGARVVAADVSPDRVAAARSAGIEAVIAPQGDLVAAFHPRQPAGADVVVDATGAPAVLQQSVKLGRRKPWNDELTEPVRLVIQGSYAENVVFDYHEAFFRELTVLVPRHSQPRDMRAVLGFLADGRLRLRDLVSEVRPASEAQVVYAALRAGRSGLLAAAFRWS
jgi:bacteriochlorophyllide a dehydrogenase